MSTVILSAIIWLWLMGGVAFGANRDETPECNYPGDATCFTMLDENGDGVLDNTPATAAFVSVTGTNAYSANIKDCPKAGGFVNQVDSTSISGTAVTKPTPIAYDKGEIACGFNVTNSGDYYSWLRVRNSVGTASVWVKANSTNGLNFDNTNETVLQPTNPYGWRQLNTLGTPRTFPLVSGPGALLMKANALLVFDCWGISTDPGWTPICQGETGASQPDYEILELGVAAAPTTWDHATWANATVMQLNGAPVGLPCTSVTNITAKFLWDDAATDRVFGTIACGNDADLQTTSAGNDTEALVTVGTDKIEFRWRQPADLFQAFNENMRLVVATPDNKMADGDWSGVDNARNLTINLNTTVTGSIAAGVAWRIFFVADAGTITADSIGLCQLRVSDRDATGSSSFVHFRGTSHTDAAQFGKCKWSSTTVGGGGPGTPVVTLAQPTSENIHPTSVQASATTTVAGNCRLHAGTSPGVYTLQSTGSPSANNTCQETITTLTPSVTYFAVMKVTNSLGVTGTSNEVTFSTPTISGATHFVGNVVSGSGNCSSAANKCLPATVWTGGWRPLQPGDIIDVTDGTYTCASCMIAPPAGLKGTEADRITIRAQNDGFARIDGGGTKVPIKLQDNKWFIIEGLNAHNSSCDVVKLGTGADNNIVRRVMAWDASATANCMVFSVHNNTGNLLEDVAGFGTGRKIFQWFASTGTFTIRRAWGRWEKNTIVGPKLTFTVAYKSHNATYENLIGTWDETSMAGASVNQPIAIFGQDGQANAADACANSQILGSIAYTIPSFEMDAINAFVLSTQYVDCITYRNVVSYAAAHPNRRALNLVNVNAEFGGPSVGQHIYANGTEIGGTTSSVGSDWTVTNRETGATVGSVPNIWNGAGSTGARVCKRYQDGQLTNTGLWPWPMDTRINQALVQAGKDPDAIFGTDNTLTDLMEDIFGTIPAACR